MTSRFIQRVEFERALERRKAKAVKMWLIDVDDRRIEGTPYAAIQILRPAGKAVSMHKSRKAGFNAVEKELHRLVIDFWKTLSAEKDRGRGDGP